MWIQQVLEIADSQGKPTGTYRLTVTSDEGGGGPFGRIECTHASAADADACEPCDEYCAKISGMPSKKKMAELRERRDRDEYERLKNKFASQEGA